MAEPADEFYVGYHPKAPPRQARFVRVVAVVHIVLAILVSVLVVAGMRDPGDGVWEDGRPHTFSGVLVKRPYPMLLDDNGRALLVVDFGKRGAQERTAGLAEGRRLTLTGYPLHRDGRLMIELSPDGDAIQTVAAPTAALLTGEPVASRVILRGEIVDSKCFLGAMKPGEGKTHKACAVRCISGGIPPMLICWDQAGRPTYFLLAEKDGGPMGAWILPLVGEGVEVTGEVERIGDLLVLRSDGVRRL